MLALGFKKHGDMSVMELFETQKPSPKADEVLIEIKASSFNHLDIWVRQGWQGLDLALPHISGSDAAGIIIECGAAVKNCQVGDRVAINPGINETQDEFTADGADSVSPGFKILGEQLPGTHTQFIALPAKNCVKIPETVSFVTAAACGLVGVTAWRMLMRQAQMRLGQKILIIGAGGGVNSFAIQLAKLAGCEVFTVTSTAEKMQQAKLLGADHVLNYRENSEWVRELMQLSGKTGFDVVVDNVGQATLNKSMRLVKRGGKIVIVGNTSGPITEIDIRFIFSKQISLIGSTMGNQQDYTEAMHLVFQEKIKPVIHAVFPLQQGVSAMQLLEKGEQFGKIVLSA